MTKKYTGVVFTTTNEEARKIASDFDTISIEYKQRMTRLFDENSNIIGTIENIYFTKDIDNGSEKNYFTVDFTLIESPQNIYVKKLIELGLIKCSVAELNSGSRFYLELVEEYFNPVYKITEKQVPQIEKLDPISAEMQEFVDTFNNSMMYETKKRLEDIEIKHYPLLKEAFDQKLVQFNTEKRIIISDTGRKYFKPTAFEETKTTQPNVDNVKQKDNSSVKQKFDVMFDDVIPKVQLTAKEQRQLVKFSKLYPKIDIHDSFYVNNLGKAYFKNTQQYNSPQFYQVPSFDGFYYIDNYKFEIQQLIRDVINYVDNYFQTA
ncbi:MAG: hypothetical protein WC679_01695 [Bacteroidales bacterium]|jgi:hypothetical protein